MRKQAFFDAGDKDTVKFKPLAGVHRHQLNGILPGLRLVVTGLQGGVGQEGRQGRQRFTGLGVGRGNIKHRLIHVQTL